MGRKNAFCATAQNTLFVIYYSNERFSAGDECVESALFKLPPHTATHVATCDFQAELLAKLLLTGTHIQKQGVATLSYSPASRLQPQVIYAIAFSAGLNGLQVY